MGHRESPRFGGFVRGGWTHDRVVRDAAERGQLLDGLMGRAVFPKSDRIVGIYVDRPPAHQGREADRRPHVVGKNEEGAAERDQPTVQRCAVEDGAHRMLADAEVEIAARAVGGIVVSNPGERGVVGRRQIGRPADQLRNAGGEGVEDRA